MCWDTRWSAAQYLKFMPYWCDIYCNILALDWIFWLWLYRVSFLVLFLVFVVVLLWTGDVDDISLDVMNSFCNRWGGVVCDKITLFYGTGWDTGGTGTLWDCKGREICGYVGVSVATGIMILFFLVACLGISDILTSEFLVLSPYYSDGTTDGVILRMARMSVVEWLRY